MASSLAKINLLLCVCKTAGTEQQKPAAAPSDVAENSTTDDTPKPSVPFGLVGSFSGNAADAVAFHIWDCAGQPVFGALHSLFMSGRAFEVRVLGPILAIYEFLCCLLQKNLHCSLPLPNPRYIVLLKGSSSEATSVDETADSLTSFVVVFRASNFTDEFSENCQKHLHILGDWLNLIALHARDAQVLLVGTHKDLLTAKQLEDAQCVVRRYVRKLHVCAKKIIRLQFPDSDSETTGRFFFDVDNKVCVIQSDSRMQTEFFVTLHCHH